MRKSKLPLSLLVAVVVLAGVVGLFWSHTSAQQTRVIHLAQGWNLVTWTGETQSASAALADLGDAVSIVYGYNNDSQTFTRCIVGRPEISTLTNFGPEEAYWVRAGRAADWSVPGPATPSCPTATPCPTGTPCPDCPSAFSPQADSCAALKAGLEVNEILLDMAEKGILVGMTEGELRASLTQWQQEFDQDCQGVSLAEASMLTYACVLAGRWKGYEEATILYVSDPQIVVWLNQFDSIIDEYCTPQH